ncbi:MinD/ParA family ATP-binding protein [Phytohabitans kaempferiae]|uniref:MinD/ParA family protein n=1 Tax=Phytohabitans kaempferiae TaxID=1620943 RepID=A0ABV6M2C3_9ACTN
MEGTETGWGRPAEPAPRWRALLDRARGGRTGEQPEVGLDPRGRRAPSPLDGRDDGPAFDLPPPRPLDGGFDDRWDDVREERGGYDGGRGYDGPPPRPRGANGAANGANGRSRASGGYAPPGAYGSPVDYSTDDGYPSTDDGYPPDARYGDQGYGDSRYPDQRYGDGRRGEPRYPDSGYPTQDTRMTGDPRMAARPGPAVVRDPVPPREPAPREPATRGEAAARGGYSRWAELEEGGWQPPAPPRPAAPPPQQQDNGYAPQVEFRQTRPDAEVERAVSVLRRDLGMPKVLAFANPKGGVHKTTATVLAAATVGSVRGRGVLAWDDNELRGTLGLRAGSARHARTIRHLIADLADVEAHHGLELKEELDDYLRHASDGSYDVLAGEESPRFAQRLDQYTVRRVLELLRRTHDVICVDTGNNVESANWQTVLQAADQLVITTVPREDAAFTADWMLDLLDEVGMGELAANAVTLLSCPTPGHSPLLDDLARHFATRTRAVAVVPYDPALETGSSIEYNQLQPETRAAWLKAASVMLEPFVR